MPEQNLCVVSCIILTGALFLLLCCPSKQQSGLPQKQVRFAAHTVSDHELTSFEQAHAKHEATTNRPRHAPGVELAVADDSEPEPAFPLVPTQPSSPHLPSYRVKYLNAQDIVREECLKENMAETIPQERIFPSSVDAAGQFTNRCNSEESRPFRPYPFM